MKMRLTRLLEAGLWAVGLFCVASFAMIKVDEVNASAAASKKFNITSEIEAKPSDSLVPSRAVAKIDKASWSTTRIDAYSRSQPAADSLDNIGLLSIENLNIEAAVFDRSNDHALNLGVGRVQGTSWFGIPGNVALAGHRDGFFRNLKGIQIGDEIRIQHKDGDDIYKVTNTRIVEPDDVSVLKDGKTPTLTLITCYPFNFIGSAPNRFIVQAAIQVSPSI